MGDDVLMRLRLETGAAHKDVAKLEQGFVRSAQAAEKLGTATARAAHQAGLLARAGSAVSSATSAYRTGSRALGIIGDVAGFAGRLTGISQGLEQQAGATAQAESTYLSLRAFPQEVRDAAAMQAYDLSKKQAARLAEDKEHLKRLTVAHETGLGTFKAMYGSGGTADAIRTAWALATDHIGTSMRLGGVAR